MMAGTSTVPKLPAELLLSVCSQLRRHDLAQVCQANSYLRALTRPLFYRFSTYTKFGLHFPGAPSPYPYLDIPGITVNRLDGLELDRIASNIEELKIPSHLPSDCAAFQNLGEGRPPRKIGVLRIECAVRIMENEELPTGDFPHFEAFPANNIADYESECYHSDYPCFFVKSLLSSKKINKVVLRDPPIGTGYAEDRSPIIHPSEEFVAVLNSQYTPQLICRDITWGVLPFWCSPLVTIVLWTGSPGERWLPPCFDNGRCVENLQEDCDCCSSCCAAADFWQSTGQSVADRRCTAVRIVNASAALEHNRSSRTGALSAKQRKSNAAAVEKHLMSGIRRKQRVSGTEWQGEVQFLSMEEWVALGEWEDVFTRKEMQPFLNAGDPASASQA